MGGWVGVGGWVATQRTPSQVSHILPTHPNHQVLCRVRPVLPVEVAAEGGKDVTEIPTPEDILVTKEDRSKARFEFDRVFAPGSSQAEVFESVQPLVVSFMDGFNCCIFAYGQTGCVVPRPPPNTHTHNQHHPTPSHPPIAHTHHHHPNPQTNSSGKTHTMEGSPEDRGVMWRALDEVFRLRAERADSMRYTVHVRGWPVWCWSGLIGFASGVPACLGGDPIVPMYPYPSIHPHRRSYHTPTT